MLRLFIIRDGEVRRRTVKLEELEGLGSRIQGDLVWVETVAPTAEEVASLARYLGVDSKSLQKLMDTPPRARYHRFYDYSAFHLPALRADPTILPEHLLLLLHDRTVVTIGSAFTHEALREAKDTLRNMAEAGKPVSPSVVAVRVVQEVVDLNNLVVHFIAGRVMELERQVERVEVSKLLGEISKLRRLMGEAYTVLLDQRSMVDLMLQHVPRWLQLDESLVSLLLITQGDLERQRQALEFRSRSLTDLIALHNVMLATRLNRVIVLLTAITATVTIPSLVANIFGMANLFSPNPVLFLFGVPIFAWQLELFALTPSLLLPLIWVLHKRWIRITVPTSK